MRMVYSLRLQIAGIAAGQDQFIRDRRQAGRMIWSEHVDLGGHPMLVISRKKNESLVINNDITITIVEIRGDKIRLGVVCPRDVPVHRQEVYEAIHGRPIPELPSRSPVEIAFLQSILEEPDD